MSSNTKTGIGLVAFLVAAIAAFGWIGHELVTRGDSMRTDDVPLGYCQAVNNYGLIVSGVDENGVCSLERLAGLMNLHPVDHDRPDIGPLVDDSIAGGDDWKVRAPTIDGGVDVSCLTSVDGGVDDAKVTDYTVTNTSTTCVRVGLSSHVDSSHGISVGSGCAAGTIFPVHGKKCRIQSEGAAVVVDVVGGRP